jgi:hypothetical protein
LDAAIDAVSVADRLGDADRARLRALAEHQT